MLKEKIIFAEDFLEAFYTMMPDDETKRRIEQIMNDIDDVREFGYTIEKKKNLLDFNIIVPEPELVELWV